MKLNRETVMVMLVIVQTVIYIGTCAIWQIPLLALWRVSYNNCFRHCETRMNCVILSFTRRYQLCQLYEGDEASIEHKPGVKLTRVDKSPTIKDLCAGCAQNHRCVIHSNGTSDCLLEQCSLLNNTIPGSELLGNKVDLGSRAVYRCPGTSLTTTVECLPDGTWSRPYILMCNCAIPNSEHVADFNYVMLNDSFIGLIQTCQPGYDLLEMDLPKCRVESGEWFDTHLSGCYKHFNSTWQKIFSLTTDKPGYFYQGWTEGHAFINDTKPYGQYRNSTVLNNWSALVLKRIRFDIMVENSVMKSMVFNGFQSTIESWFSKERLLESSWQDLSSTSDMDTLSIPGLQKQTYLRFLVGKFIDRSGDCSLDTGWFVACTSCYPCGVRSGRTFIYANGNTTARFESSEMSHADRIEVWIEQ